MFDVAWSELLLLGGVAVMVIGPKDMPRALYAAGKFARKVRIFTSDLQKSFDRIMEEEELDDITRHANKAGGDSLQFEIEKQIAEEDRRRAIEQSHKLNEDDATKH